MQLSDLIRVNQSEEAHHARAGAEQNDLLLQILNCTQHPTGEAKFWLYPVIEVAQNWGLSDRRLSTALRLAREYADEIRDAWQAHFDR
ncbi:MAG TPA: DUF4160 domain-containing protein [Gemmatimonadaceae bacterium]|nr:DUF4160 domain-containing protein [Gemmatimonadaceae bacterium]